MKKNNFDFKVLKGIALITQIGLSIVTPILLGVFLGQFIDKKLATNYIFTLICIIIGTLAGFLNIFKFGARPKDKE